MIPRFAMVVVLAGCGGRAHAPDDAGPARDAAVSHDAAAGEDAAVGEDAGAPLVCDCAEGVPVGLFHACTPPLEMGCPIRTCTPGGDDCPEGDSCLDCAAAACCVCAACVPACVHTEASPGDAMPELLKLRSTFGPADEEATLTIEGTPFYVGALGYAVRIGASREDILDVGGGECALEVAAPAQPSGTMLPVWVSQYGFGDPFVLAGFFSWIEGDDYPTCVQPGLSCDEGRGCCETDDVPMTCQSGRCRRG